MSNGNIPLMSIFKRCQMTKATIGCLKMHPMNPEIEKYLDELDKSCFRATFIIQAELGEDCFKESMKEYEEFEKMQKTPKLLEDAFGIRGIVGPNGILGDRGNMVCRGMSDDDLKAFANWLEFSLGVPDPWLYIEAEDYEVEEYLQGMMYRGMFVVAYATA